MNKLMEKIEYLVTESPLPFAALAVVGIILLSIALFVLFLNLLYWLLGPSFALFLFLIGALYVISLLFIYMIRKI